MQNLWRCRCRRVVDLKLPILLVIRGGHAEITNLKVICPVVIYSTNKNIVVFHHIKIPLAIRFRWKQQPRNSECDPPRNVLHFNFEKELIRFIVVIPVGCVLVLLQRQIVGVFDSTTQRRHHKAETKRKRGRHRYPC